MTKYKLCPIEPTPEMIDAADDVKDSNYCRSEDYENYYEAMTAECETVEVVDLIYVIAQRIKENPVADGSIMDIRNYMAENNMKIIRTTPCQLTEAIGAGDALQKLESL